MPRVTVVHTAGRTPPRVPFQALKAAVLPSSYALSIATVSDARMRSLNRRYRKRDSVANVLSFPLSKKEGELLLSLTEARRGAKKFNMTYQTFVTYLVIHGLLHLKGLRHGSTMSQAESKLLRRFAK
jgi:probable rRNA maturation factor